jgi:hypothetical protein
MVIQQFACPTGLVAALVGRVAQLGHRDEFAQDLDVGVAVGLAADEDLHDLLEVQKPERQIEVVRGDDLGALAEAGGVFAVDVEQQDVGLRVADEDALQDQRHDARLAGAGGAQHGEVLAQQLVQLGHRRDRGVLVDMAYANGLGEVAGIGPGKLTLAGAPDHVAERRIGGDAAAEAAVLVRFGRLVDVPRQLADELHLGDPELLVRSLVGRRRGAQRRDQRQRGGVQRVDLQQGADLGVLHAAQAGELGGIQQDDGVAAGDRDDAPDALELAVAFGLRWQNCGGGIHGHWPA